MIRILAIAASMPFATAASAQGYYSVTPAVAPTKASVITGGMLWKCDGGICTAGRGSSRDGIVCEQVVKRVGALTSFSANGAAFDTAALAKCNARAK